MVNCPSSIYKPIFSLSCHPLICCVNFRNLLPSPIFLGESCSESSWEMLLLPRFCRGQWFSTPRGFCTPSLPRGYSALFWTHFGCDDVGRGYSWHLVGRGQSDSGRTDPTTKELSGPKCQQCCRRKKTYPDNFSFFVWIYLSSPWQGVSNPVCQIMGQLLRHINKQAGSLGSRSFKIKSQAVYFLWSRLPPDAVSLLSPVPLLTPAVKTRSRALLRKTVDEGGACLSLVSVSVDSKSVR